MDEISVISFYRGGPNDRGVTLEEIWRWDDATLESRHDFIQWLFPLREPSQFNPSAPLTDDQTIGAFQADKTLRDKMVHSLDVMLKFYGFERNEGIERGANFARQAKNWLHPGNHNYLRITRILTSLHLHGLGDEAKAFFKMLNVVYNTYPNEIGSKTFSFWKSAANADKLFP